MLKILIQDLQNLDRYNAVFTDKTLNLLLGALADQLHALGSHVEIVVIGGSALTALGLVRRATRDVDLLAIAEKGELRPAEPLPQPLLTARTTVAADFGLPDNWLNAGLRSTSSSSLWSTRAEGVMKPIFGRSTRLGMNSQWRRAGR